jgi:HD-like signal output (HDOD) protein
MMDKSGEEKVSLVKKDISILEKAVSKMPPLPSIIKNLLNYAFYETVPVSQIVEDIGKDPTLAGQILKFANSQLLSPIRVSTLEHAIVLLGTKNVFRIAIALWAKNIGDTYLPGYQQKKGELSLNSFIGGYASKRIAEVSYPSVSYLAFSAAVLRNIGKIAIDQIVLHKKSEIIQEIFKGKSAIEVEEEILGITFTDANYMVAQVWNLPEELKIPMKFFKTPHLVPDDIPEYIKFTTYIVHVGDVISQMVGIGSSFDNLVERFSKKSFDILKISEKYIEMIFTETFLKTEQILYEFFGEDETLLKLM